jgi:hypothetical protein
VLQLATGVLPPVLPVHPHDGLQQSQKRVVNPACPVVGGTQARLDELELLLVELDDERDVVLDTVPLPEGELVELTDTDVGVPLETAVPDRLLDDERLPEADERLPPLVESDMPAPPNGSTADWPHAATTTAPNVKIAKLAIFIDRTPRLTPRARRTQALLERRDMQRTGWLLQSPTAGTEHRAFSTAVFRRDGKNMPRA